MATPPVVLLTRIAGRQSTGVPGFGGPVTVTPPSFTCTSYMPHPAGQGDITWKGNLFGFPAPAAGAQVQRIAVTVTHRVSDVAAFSGVTAQVYAGASPVGSPASLTLSATNISDTFTVTTGYAAAQLPDLAVRVNWHAVAPGLAYITSAYAQASYSFPASITGFTIDPVAAFPQATPNVGLPPVALVSAGAVSASLSPSFGQPTTAGDLLVAWVSSNSGSATFDTAVTGAGWLLAGFTGTAFEWNSLWYKPGCSRAESPPVFSSTGGQATSPLSGLLEFRNARYLDQVAGTTATQSLTFAPASADTASGDLVFAFAAWGTSSAGPASITMTGTDSSGAALPLSVSDNAASAGHQFWVTGWAQAGQPFGPVTDSVTAGIGMFGNGGGVLASFKAFSAAGSQGLPSFAPMRRRAVTVPVRAG